MKICRLSSFCDTALRLLFTVLVSIAFIFNAIPAVAENTKGVVSISEHAAKTKKSAPNAIVVAEEEVEEKYNYTKEDLAGNYLLPVNILRCKTKDLPAVIFINTYTGTGHIKKPAFYILYRQLKVFVY